MKHYVYSALTIVFSLMLQQDNHVGKYIFRGDRYYASIELKENKEFLYYTTREFARYEIQGNYNIVGDSLVLDSHPQRDKIIVHESSKGKKNKIVIAVTDKREHLLNYTLTLILEDNTVEILEDQFEESVIKNKSIKAFYITDTEGLKSPTYYKQGKFTNYLKVLFETRRVFENEKWYIKDDEIRPRGLEGTFERYHFTKQQ